MDFDGLIYKKFNKLSIYSKLSVMFTLALCYIKLDIIHRILKEYYDIHPVVAIGVTDVSEEIFNKSKLLRKPIWEITTKYTADFFDHMNALNILQPSFKLKVSDHINVILDFVEYLVKREAAYRGYDGCIYFDTQADPNYGRFREAVKTVESDDFCTKRDPRDFAVWKMKKDISLWKSKKEFFKGSINSGYPGWHIECSAMASHVFGSSIDIHSGGSDLIFPHHENEEAQSTRYHRCDQWVNYWLHTGLINVRNEKMSKSLGNFLSIREFLSYNKSDHLRMFCFMSSYRSDLNFDDTTMNVAVNICDKVSDFLNIAQSYIIGIWHTGNIEEAKILQELEKTEINVNKHLANDFGTSEALKEVMGLIKICLKMLNDNSTETCSRSPAVVSRLADYVRDFFRSFGFTFTDAIMKKDGTSAIDTVITAAVNIRSNIRETTLKMKQHDKEKMIELCDKFREKLLHSGIIIRDLGPSRSNWLFNSESVNNNKTLLKDVIDYVVWFRSEILQFLSAKSVNETTSSLSEFCRYIQLYFATLGVHIVDHPNGYSDWSFPSMDTSNAPNHGKIVLKTLHFEDQVKEFAERLSNKQEKEELLCLCEFVRSEFEELGVNVNEKNNIYVVEDEKGTVPLYQTLEIIAHFREQILTIAQYTEDAILKNQINKVVGRIKKSLASFGFYFIDKSLNVLSCWKMKYPAVNKAIYMNLVDLIVKLTYDVMAYSNSTDDHVCHCVLNEICLSVLYDLRSLGINTSLGKKDVKWNFEPTGEICLSPISCIPGTLMRE